MNEPVMSDDNDTTNETPDEPLTDTARSPRRSMCAAILSLEAIVLGLSTPVMISLAHTPVKLALAMGVGLAVACVLLAGMLRSPAAYVAGYVLQAGAIALGFVVMEMFFLGAIFAALWAGADQLGRRIERERAEAYAAYAAGSDQPETPTH